MLFYPDDVVEQMEKLANQPADSSHHQLENEDDDFEDEFESDFDELPPPPPLPKIGRNEPCWCGSGKKYKKCHLASDEGERVQ